MTKAQTKHDDDDSDAEGAADSAAPVSRESHGNHEARVQALAALIDEAPPAGVDVEPDDEPRAGAATPKPGPAPQSAADSAEIAESADELALLERLRGDIGDIGSLREEVAELRALRDELGELRESQGRTAETVGEVGALRERVGEIVDLKEAQGALGAALATLSDEATQRSKANEKVAEELREEIEGQSARAVEQLRGELADRTRASAHELKSVRDQLKALAERVDESREEGVRTQAEAVRDVEESVEAIRGALDAERSRTDAASNELRAHVTRRLSELTDRCDAFERNVARQDQLADELRAAQQSRAELRSAQQAFEERILVALDELSARVSRYGDRLATAEERLRSAGSDLAPEEVEIRFEKLHDGLVAIGEQQLKLQERTEDLSDAVASLARSVDERGLSETASRAERPGAPAEEERPTLATATFEQLRDVGLSVTQAARLIAFRGAGTGEFKAADLDRVPGIPSELRERLAEFAGG